MDAGVNRLLAIGNRIIVGWALSNSQMVHCGNDNIRMLFNTLM